MWNKFDLAWRVRLEQLSMCGKPTVRDGLINQRYDVGILLAGRSFRGPLFLFFYFLSRPLIDQAGQLGGVTQVVVSEGD